jgi:hypothetical protein
LPVGPLPIVANNAIRPPLGAAAVAPETTVAAATIAAMTPAAPATLRVYVLIEMLPSVGCISTLSSGRFCVVGWPSDLRIGRPVDLRRPRDQPVG